MHPCLSPAKIIYGGVENNQETLPQWQWVENHQGPFLMWQCVEKHQGPFLSANVWKTTNW